MPWTNIAYWFINHTHCLSHQGIVVNGKSIHPNLLFFSPRSVGRWGIDLFKLHLLYISCTPHFSSPVYLPFMQKLYILYAPPRPLCLTFQIPIPCASLPCSLLYIRWRVRYCSLEVRHCPSVCRQGYQGLLFQSTEGLFCYPKAISGKGDIEQKFLVGLKACIDSKVNLLTALCYYFDRK